MGNKYKFPTDITPFGSYELSTDEFEDICINADDDSIIPCNNCFAILLEEEDRQSLNWCSDSFRLVRKVQDINHKLYVDIKVSDELGEKEIRIPLSSFTESKLSTLAVYGVFCETDEKVRTTLSQYLIKQLSAMPVETAETSVGFVQISDEELTFIGYDKDDKERLICHNSFDTEEEYISALNKLIEVSVPLQFMVSISVASILLAYLSLCYDIPVKSFIINIINKSTTGKSSSQELAASMISSITDSRVIAPIHATENALVHMLSGSIGIVKHYDEGTASILNKENLIYTISNEREKARMQSDGNMRSSSKFKTIVTISSEEAFMEASVNRHQGLAVRLHKYRGLQFTTSREHAEEIHEFAAKNSGIIGYKVVNYLMLEDDGDVLEWYNNCREYLRERIGSNSCSLTERLISQYSLILLAADLLNEFGLDIDPEKIADILIDNHNSVSVETDIGKNAYEVLMDFVSRSPYNTGIKSFPERKETAIIESLFIEVLHKSGYNDVKTVLNELDAKGYTKRREKNRKKVKLSINGNSCYCILLDASKLEGEDNVHSKIKSYISEAEELESFSLDEEDIQ